MTPCRRCSDRPAWKRQLCRACYEHPRRTGQPRPVANIVRARWRTEENRLAREAGMA